MQIRWIKELLGCICGCGAQSLSSIFSTSSSYIPRRQLSYRVVGHSRNAAVIWKRNVRYLYNCLTRPLARLLFRFDRLRNQSDTSRSLTFSYRNGENWFAKFRSNRITSHYSQMVDVWSNLVCDRFKIISNDADHPRKYVVGRIYVLNYNTIRFYLSTKPIWDVI